MYKTEGKKAGESGRIEIWEHFGAVMLGGLIVLGVLVITGTLQSGYHFADDHELIRMEYGFRVGAVAGEMGFVPEEEYQVYTYGDYSVILKNF